MISLKLLGPSQHYRIEGFKGPSIRLHYARDANLPNSGLRSLSLQNSYLPVGLILYLSHFPDRLFISLSQQEVGIWSFFRPSASVLDPLYFQIKLHMCTLKYLCLYNSVFERNIVVNKHITMRGNVMTLCPKTD